MELVLVRTYTPASANPARTGDSTDLLALLFDRLLKSSGVRRQAADVEEELRILDDFVRKDVAPCVTRFARWDAPAACPGTSATRSSSLPVTADSRSVRWRRCLVAERHVGSWRSPPKGRPIPRIESPLGDYSGPIRPAAICRDLAGCYAGRPIEVSRATASSNKCL